jgi:multiple sugar transport system permease protein
MTDSSSSRLAIYAAAALIVGFSLFPFAWMLLISLSKSPNFLSGGASFAPTLENYADVLEGSSLRFGSYLRNSVIISSIVATATTIIAGLAAYAITRIKFPGRRAVPAVVLALSMLPQISLAGYIFGLMTDLKWMNTYQALVLPYIALGLPLALWIMMSHFAQIPVDLDKAALVDGATRFQTLRKVIVPVAMPGVVSTLILIFIFSFNEFLFALMLTVDYRARTIPVGIALFQGTHGQTPWGSIMAAAVMSCAPLVLLAALFQRRIIQGLTQGSVKG